MDRPKTKGWPHYHHFTKEIQYFLDHLDDADSQIAFIDMMHGHIGNEIYKENNDG